MQLQGKDPIIMKNGTYVIDLFNNNPIFYVNNEYFVRDWNEAFHLHGNPSIEDINFRYLAAYITDQCDSNISPYKRIRRIPRGCKVSIQDNKYFLRSRYKFKKNNNLKEIPLKEVLSLIEGKIESLLISFINKNPGNIGCELSSGLDSNSIVSFLTKKIDFPRNKIFTISGDNDEEGLLVNKFKELYGLHKENCFGNSDIELAAKDKKLEFFLEKAFKTYGCPYLRGENYTALELLKSKNCKSLISGLGGDQGLSHHGRNVQTDLLINLNFQELLYWYEEEHPLIVSKKIISRIGKLVLKKPFELRTNMLLKKNILNNILIRHLTTFGKQKIIKNIRYEYPWEIDELVEQKKSISNRLLSEWVCIRAEEEKRMCKALGINKFFPFLDEELISILLQINTQFFNQKGNERYLIRELFKKYLPDYLYKNPNKYRAVSEDTRNKKRYYYLESIEYLIKELNNKSLLALKLWKMDNLIEEIENKVYSKNASNYEIVYSWIALSKVHATNSWLEKLHGESNN